MSQNTTLDVSLVKHWLRLHVDLQSGLMGFPQISGIFTLLK